MKNTLINSPYLWAIKPWRALIGGVALLCTAMLLAYTQKAGKLAEELSDPMTMAVFVAALSAAGLLWWGWKATIFRPFEQFIAEKASLAHQRLWLYFGIVALPVFAPWVAYHQIVYQHASMVSDGQLWQDVDALNAGNLLFPTQDVPEALQQAAEGYNSIGNIHVLFMPDSIQAIFNLMQKDAEDARTLDSLTLDRFDCCFFIPNIDRLPYCGDDTRQAIFAGAFGQNAKAIEPRPSHKYLAEAYMESYSRYAYYLGIGTAEEALQAFYEKRPGTVPLHAKEYVRDRIHGIAYYKEQWALTDWPFQITLLLGVCVFLASIIQTVLWTTRKELVIGIFTSVLAVFFSAFVAAIFGEPIVFSVAIFTAMLVGVGKLSQLTRATAYNLSNVAALVAIQISSVALPLLIGRALVSGAREIVPFLLTMGAIVYVIFLNGYFAKLAQIARGLPKAK